MLFSNPIDVLDCDYGVYKIYYDVNQVPSTLTEIVINGGNELKSWAFYDMKSLFSLSLPESINACGSYVITTNSILNNTEF